MNNPNNDALNPDPPPRPCRTTRPSTRSWAPAPACSWTSRPASRPAARCACSATSGTGRDGPLGGGLPCRREHCGSEWRAAAARLARCALPANSASLSWPPAPFPSGPHRPSAHLAAACCGATGVPLRRACCPPGASATAAAAAAAVARLSWCCSTPAPKPRRRPWRQSCSGCGGRRGSRTRPSLSSSAACGCRGGRRMHRSWLPCASERTGVCRRGPA